MNDGDKQGSVLFKLTLWLQLAYFVMAVAVSVLNFPPYAVAFGFGAAFRRGLWAILIPASVFLPFASLFSNILVKRLTPASVIGVFAFSAPVAASAVILNGKTAGYIMLACIFGIGAPALHFILRDLCGENEKENTAPLILGALNIVLIALLLALEIRVLAHGMLTQFKMLFIAPLTLVPTAGMSICRAKWQMTDRLGAIRTLVWNALAALYCGYCGFDEWAPWTLTALASIVFGMSVYEYIKYVIKRRKNESIYREA